MCCACVCCRVLLLYAACLVPRAVCCDSVLCAVNSVLCFLWYRVVTPSDRSELAQQLGGRFQSSWRGELAMEIIAAFFWMVREGRTHTTHTYIHNIQHLIRDARLTLSAGKHHHHPRGGAASPALGGLHQHTVT